MTLPTIHTNGTSASNLADDYEECAHLLRKAVDKICESGPNGRDYYPQGDGVIHQASAEHFDRLERLNAIIEEFNQLAGHCANFVR